MNKPSFVTWRPRTTAILIIGLAALLVCSVGLYIFTNFKSTAEVRIASGVFQLQVADTEAARAQGLSGVDKLAPNGGLLMKFDSDDLWGIWMKDMKIPLDIVWLDSDKKVIYTVKNAGPELSTEKIFQPKSKARYVIELKAGSVQQYNIKVGDTAQFTIPEVFPWFH